MKLTLTTNHPSSSYGIPVLVDENGNAYGPADRIKTTETAAEFVRRAQKGRLRLERFSPDSAPSLVEHLVVDDPEIDPVDVLAPRNDRYLDLFLAR